MSHEKKFEQIWGFRRRDDEFDSLSDDSKSNSRGNEPVLKKHKLFPDFILPENDDYVDYSQRSHDKDLLDQGTMVCIEENKTNNEYNGPRKNSGSVETKNKTARAPKGLLKKAPSKKKSKNTSQVSVSDDLRIFTETVIEELRVARENMFAQTREDMRKIITSRPTRRRTRKRGVRKTIQKQQNKSTTVVSNKPAKAKKCKNVLEEKDNHDQTNETITSDEKEKDAERSLVKSTIHNAHPGQVVSTTYQTLPSFLSNSQATGNDSSLNLERENLFVDTNGQPNYFSSIQTGEPFRSYGQENESFCTGTGFSIPLCGGLNNNFNIFRPVLENTSLRDTSDIVDNQRMNGGGVRLSRALPDHFVPDNFRSFYQN